MNNLLLLLVMFSLTSCSVLYAPKAPTNEVSKDLCNRACGLGKDSCSTQCSSTAKDCLTACNAGFSSCSTECEKTETDVIAELEKLKAKVKL